MQRLPLYLCSFALILLISGAASAQNSAPSEKYPGLGVRDLSSPDPRRNLPPLCGWDHVKDSGDGKYAYETKDCGPVIWAAFDALTAGLSIFAGSIGAQAEAYGGGDGDGRALAFILSAGLAGGMSALQAAPSSGGQLVGRSGAAGQGRCSEQDRQQLNQAWVGNQCPQNSASMGCRDVLTLQRACGFK